MHKSASIAFEGDEVFTSRPAHQPHLFQKRPVPTSDELRHACERSIAVVLATDLGTRPLKVVYDDPDEQAWEFEAAEPTPRPLQEYEGRALVAHAVALARECRFASVSVVVPDEAELFERVSAAVLQAAGRTSSDEVCVCEYDRMHDFELTKQLNGFELFGASAGMLEIARDQLRSAIDEGAEIDSVVFFACDQPRLTPAHVLELVRRWKSSTPDAASSWIHWGSRLPLVVKRELVESYDEGSLVQALHGTGYRPMPRLNVVEHVFGEERLDANYAGTPALDAFLEGHTLTALEAVGIARERMQEKAAVHSESASDNAGAEELCEADERLVRCAIDICTDLDAALSPAELQRVESANAWACRNRGDFPLLWDREHRGRLAYFDSAATAQRVACSLFAQSDFDEHSLANIYRGDYKLSIDATAAFNAARKTLEDFIGAGKGQLAFTANASSSVALVAQAWGERNIGPGDCILVAESEHHSNLLPWKMLASRVGAQVHYIPVLADGRLDLERYAELLGLNPKLVCVAHVSNVLGIVNPIERMARMAHDRGARLMLDAAQSITHMRLNVEELGVDFIAFSGHKMYGPMGIGGLWIAEDASEEMDPMYAGGGSISHVGRDSYYLREGTIQYELGTQPVSQAVGWAGAVDYIESLNSDSVHEHRSAMTRYLLRGLSLLETATVFGDHTCADGETGLVALAVAGASADLMGSFCGALDVAVRAGGHCAIPLAASMGVTGTLRISMAVHTTQREIEAALVALRMLETLLWKETNTATDVVNHYAQVARSVAGALQDQAETCSIAQSGSEAFGLYAHEVLDGLPEGALRASRGCGDPVARASLQSGETVLDLGSGGGIDALIAARLVGSVGKVYGLDMTPEMVELARGNARDARVSNVEFLQGDISAIPLPDSSVDVVVSNCVINLCDDKEAVFREVLRVLRPGGRMCVSDIVAFEDIPEACTDALSKLTGCVRGISSRGRYEELLRSCGFDGVDIEQKTLYTHEVLEEKARRKGREALFEQVRACGTASDGVCGSAIIQACAPRGELL